MVAKTARHAREQELPVERGRQQRGPRRVAHLQHELDVLQVLGELAFRLEMALDHALALDVHRSRIGPTLLEDGEQGPAVIVAR